MTTIPEVQRVSYAEHAAAAAAGLAEPDEAGRLAAEACRLEPLQRIQTTGDQLATNAVGRVRGEFGPYGHNYSAYIRDEFKAMDRHRQVLRCAADAADAMIARLEAQVLEQETAMADAKKDGPKLTTSGEPHPLEKGGYDANADPQLPSNISDVSALKEGKTTHAQSEAIAASDAEEPRDENPIPTEAPLDTEADQPKPKSHHKGKGHK